MHARIVCVKQIPCPLPTYQLVLCARVWVSLSQHLVPLHMMLLKSYLPLYLGVTPCLRVLVLSKCTGIKRLILASCFQLS